ncbi:MAG: polysaccharide biosynthesis/export family protein [Paraprevotella sp.]|nr:polysaccharide biosynthesis/export family protein [Paraprevotella sp.]
MNKLLLSAMALVLALSFSSCASKKEFVYFQGCDSLYLAAQNIEQQYEMRIKPADNIMVKITCEKPELLRIFAQDVMMGSAYQQGTNVQGTHVNNVYGYTVNNKGEVTLPAIGSVKVDGMTTDECADAIEKKIIAAQLIQNPDVTVRLMNARVAVVGGVRRPGMINLTSERNTIIDVLAQAGDVDDDGLKKNIKLFREVNGERVMYNVDLTRSDVFTNPAFYVQQNDMIYVEPNRSKAIKASPGYTYLSVGAQVLGAISTIVSTVVLIIKL